MLGLRRATWQYGNGARTTIMISNKKLKLAEVKWNNFEVERIQLVYKTSQQLSSPSFIFWTNKTSFGNKGQKHSGTKGVMSTLNISMEWLHRGIRTTPSKVYGMRRVCGLTKATNWLGSSRTTSSICNQRFLSRVGREVILKSTIKTIPSYFMGVFLLPKEVIKDIETTMNAYW